MSFRRGLLGAITAVVVVWMMIFVIEILQIPVFILGAIALTALVGLAGWLIGICTEGG